MAVMEREKACTLLVAAPSSYKPVACAACSWGCGHDNAGTEEYNKEVLDGLTGPWLAWLNVEVT